MKPLILEKLEQLVSKGLKTEAEIVYFLSEVRKLMEHDNTLKEKFVLKFWCDWCFHTKIANPYAQKIISLLDTAGEYHSKGMKIDELPQPLKQELEEMIHMRSFRLELHRFLQEQKLPTTITSDEGNWGVFLTLYCLVIEQCPLVIYSNDGISNIRTVEVGVRPVTNKLWELRWGLTEKSGKLNAYSQLIIL